MYAYFTFELEQMTDVSLFSKAMYRILTNGYSKFADILKNKIWTFWHKTA